MEATEDPEQRCNYFRKWLNIKAMKNQIYSLYENNIDYLTQSVAQELVGLLEAIGFDQDLHTRVYAFTDEVMSIKSADEELEKKLLRVEVRDRLNRGATFVRNNLLNRVFNAPMEQTPLQHEPIIEEVPEE